MIPITDYFAFSDESNHSNGDYRSIALIEIHEDYLWNVEQKLRDVLNKYNTSIISFKWKSIKNNNKTNALIELLEFLFPLMEDEIIRIEVLIWNIYDDRHNIVGRDDSKNLSYMYDKLIKDFAERHLNENDTLYLFSDQNSAIDWNELENILFYQGIYSKTYLEEFDITLGSNKVFIKESSTQEDPIIQIADIFAGMGRSSFEDFDVYEQWLNPQQQTLFGSPTQPTNRQKYRFKIYKIVDDWAKNNKLQISLQSTRGFISHNPKAPLNFWMYESKHEKDKAPRRKK